MSDIQYVYFILSITNGCTHVQIMGILPSLSLFVFTRDVLRPIPVTLNDPVRSLFTHVFILDAMQCKPSIHCCTNEQMSLNDSILDVFQDE